MNFEHLFLAKDSCFVFHFYRCDRTTCLCSCNYL